MSCEVGSCVDGRIEKGGPGGGGGVGERIEERHEKIEGIK